MPQRLGLLLVLALAVLFDFYRQHFHLLAASAAVQWITMQGVAAESDSAQRAKRDRLQRARKARRARRISEWMDDLQVMDDDDFINMFRISREVLAEITPAMAQPMSHFVDRYGIPVEMCCLIPIKYFASAMPYIDMAIYFGIPKSILHKIVDAFLLHFPRRFKRTWVRIPTYDEMEDMAADFKAVRGLPNVIGAIDGTHIEIKGLENHRQEYYNRKGVYSTQLQVTCDSKGYIWDYVVGHPGSMHDQGVFQQSHLHARLERATEGDRRHKQLEGGDRHRPAVVPPERHACIQVAVGCFSNPGRLSCAP
ncbi:unnamed protein product [Closterium sp. NIES-65]|nr:unnamed protein product [Closterium sp. NIES-65]